MIPSRNIDGKRKKISQEKSFLKKVIVQLSVKLDPDLLKMGYGEVKLRTNENKFAVRPLVPRPCHHTTSNKKNENVRRRQLKHHNQGLCFILFFREVTQSFVIKQDYNKKQFCKFLVKGSTSPHCPDSIVEYHKRTRKQQRCVETKGVHLLSQTKPK